MNRPAHVYPRGRLIATSISSALMCVGLTVTAHADTVDQAQQQAHTIATQIGRLQPQVEAALAAYDTALDGVAQTVGASVAARRVYDALELHAETLRTQQRSHLIALYESGGTLALYADVLGTGDLNRLHQVPYVSGVAVDDATAAAGATRMANAAKALLDSTQHEIDTDLAGADAVNQRLQQLQGVLAEQQALLDQASGRAKDLQDLQQAATDLALTRAAVEAAGTQAAATALPSPVPGPYRSMYEAAAQTCPGLPWTVLAAIGQVETHHGSGTMVSSAGALGPMQFLPATFVGYATDGDHDGKADIMDPADSIFTAARYLCANGGGNGGQNLYTAIWNYNHADWYVQLVLALAAKIS